MHALYINERRIAWPTNPDRFQHLVINEVDLKNTKGQNMGQSKSKKICQNDQKFQNAIYM